MPALAATWKTMSHPAAAASTAPASATSPWTCSAFSASSAAWRERDRLRTRSPRATRRRATAPPRNPPPPVTRAFMPAPFGLALLPPEGWSRLGEQRVELSDIGGGGGLEDAAEQFKVFHLLRPRQ